jgi:anti-anti-sigma factor
MEFQIKEGKETRVTLTGKLNFARAPLLMDDLAALKGKDIESIVFECRELTYISSAGIRAIIYARRKIAPGVTVCVEDASDDVKEVLDMCGLIDIIEIRETE